MKKVWETINTIGFALLLGIITVYYWTVKQLKAIWRFLKEYWALVLLAGFATFFLFWLAKLAF